MSLFPASAIPAGSTGYDIDNSLRFNDDDSADLSRTPSSEGNRRTFTISYWLKRGSLNDWKVHFDQNEFTLHFDTSSGYYRVMDYTGSYNFYAKMTASSRDPSAWYHIVVAVDSTQATASDRLKIYFNGEQQTDLSWYSYPSLNFQSQWNTTNTQRIGSTGGANYFDGYMAEVHSIDGQALGPTSFGETGDYGEWKPIEYAGTYGSKGFYLDFKTAGTGTTGAGKDVSGNGNHFSTSGIASTDQMVDTPTNNFCTWNPLDRFAANLVGTLSEGNLKIVDNVNHVVYRATTGYSSGKWYWEVYMINVGNPGSCHTGICRTNTSSANSGTMPGDTGDAWTYNGNGNKYVGDGGGNTTYGASYTAGDIISVALDLDNNTITFYKNNSSQGQLASGLTDEFTPLIEEGSHTSQFNTVANFGQDSSFAGNKTAQGNQDSNDIGDFYYTPPTGFLSLCTKNLPDPAVIPSEHFNTVTYTGDGASTQAVPTTFEPDLIWSKIRNQALNHRLYDRVRGLTHNLLPNTSGAEDGITDYGQPTATSSTSVTVGQGTESGNLINASGYTGVLWNWKANGAGGTGHTQGTISSTASVNADAGFSIVKYTGTGSSGTVGHGLGVEPDLIISKSRDASHHWWVHGNAVGTVDTNYLILQEGYALDTATNVITSIDATTISIDTNAHINTSGHKYIQYYFKSIDGYSKAGTYTPNGNSDGPFVYCGFTPQMVIIKNVSRTQEWIISDSVRDDTNPATYSLQPNSSTSEGSGNDIDYVSNGFKIRASGSGINYASGDTMVFIAFAESPFKHTNAK